MTGPDSTNDGYYYGWVVTTACFIGTFVIFGVSYSFGVFFEPLASDFDLSRGATSLVFSVQTLMIYVGAALFGGVADRYGVRRVMGTGVVLLALGLLWTSEANSITTLGLAYGVITALGMGLIYVVSYATVPRWFERRRGFASGIATAGLGVGMVAVTPVATLLIARYGWRRAYLALVAGLVALLVVATVLIEDDPRERGVPASEFPAGYPETRSRSRGWLEQARDIVSIATGRRFLLVFFGWILIYGTLYVTLVHLVAHVTDLGLDARIGALALTIIGATTAASRMAIGFASDRLGRNRTFIGCSILMAVSTFALPVLSSPAGFVAFAAVFGAAYGGNGALLSPLTVDLFGPDDANALFGVVSLSFAVSGLFAPPLAGASYDLFGTYTPAFVAAGVAGLAGAALTGLATWRTGTRSRAA
ncbi:MFS transporter [Saliphagus sp. GCM10025317]